MLINPYLYRNNYEPVVDKGIPGDVNADGKVNIKDATAIQKCIAGLDTGYHVGKLIASKENI